MCVKAIEAIHLKMKGMGVFGGTGYREERKGKSDITVLISHVIKSCTIMKYDVKILSI